MGAAPADESWEAVGWLDLPGDIGKRSDAITVDGVRYGELSANGFGGLIAWAAGLHRVRRIADELSHQTRVEIIANGGTSSYVRPRSLQEQREVDDDIDEYLHFAGIPPRPRGFRWFVEIPEGLTPDDLWGTINREVSDSAIHPAEILADVRTTLSRLYSAT